MSQDVLSIIASFFGSFGFAIIYNIRGRRVLIPAIGGAGSLYYAMDAALRRDMPQFIVKGQAAIGLAIALAAGIMVVTSLRRPIEALVHIVAKKKY